uniref:Uncharacterized protein n=1 Tax=Lactuca sativa TaxID=4236 RepID=A0A9R1UUV4_LACSA|nr:hypothetical protein LSAT_V11C800393440 [Lactuca sativa]
MPLHVYSVFKGFVASRLMLKRTKGKGLMKRRFSLKTVTNDKSMTWNLKLSVLEYGDLAGDMFLNLWIPLDKFVEDENVVAGNRDRGMSMVFPKVCSNKNTLKSPSSIDGTKSQQKHMTPLVDARVLYSWKNKSFMRISNLEHNVYIISSTT